jgi:hypothetical protein
MRFLIIFNNDKLASMLHSGMHSMERNACIKMDVEGSLSIRYQASLLNRLTRDGPYRLRLDRNDLDGLLRQNRLCVLETAEGQARNAVITEVSEEDGVFLVTLEKRR